jgi:hypothetical protein
MTFAQIDADGVKLAGDIVVPLGDSQAPEIAWTGSRFAVTFNYDPTPSMNPPYDTEARFALLECAELIW